MLTDALREQMTAVPWPAEIESELFLLANEADEEVLCVLRTHFVRMAVAFKDIHPALTRQIGVLDSLIRGESWREGEYTTSDLMKYIDMRRIENGNA